MGPRPQTLPILKDLEELQGKIPFICTVLAKKYGVTRQNINLLQRKHFPDAVKYKAPEKIKLKVCSICGILKPISEYGFKQHSCTDCLALNKRKCVTCGEVFIHEKKKSYCKACFKKRMLDYFHAVVKQSAEYKENKSLRTKYHKEWYAKNKERLTKYYKEYYKNKQTKESENV